MVSANFVDAATYTVSVWQCKALPKEEVLPALLK